MNSKRINQKCRLVSMKPIQPCLDNERDPANRAKITKKKLTMAMKHASGLQSMCSVNLHQAQPNLHYETRQRKIVRPGNIRRDVHAWDSDAMKRADEIGIRRELRDTTRR